MKTNLKRFTELQPKKRKLIYHSLESKAFLIQFIINKYDNEQ